MAGITTRVSSWSRIYGGRPAAFGDPAPNTALPYAAALVGGTFVGGTFFGLAIRTLRQLRTVRRLHAEAANINLLNLEPAHAFASLTARSAIGIILVLILGTAATAGDDPSFALFDIGALTALALFAVVVFVVPLSGMRDLLEEEKKRVLNNTTGLLQMASDGLESKVRNRDYADLQGMDTAIKALIRKREMLEKVPTWPWNPGTIRGFVSTLLLPIFLWLVTQLLGRFF